MKKIKLKQIILGLAMVLSMGVWGQNENRNWIFGTNVRLNFDQNGNITNGQNLQNFSDYPSNFYTHEGSTVCSNQAGSLVFYTDGRRLYDNNNNLIEQNLGGDASSTSSAISFPVPGSSNRYYLFTITLGDIPNSQPSSLNYYVIETGNFTTINNQPTNIRIVSRENIQGTFSEKLVVILDENSCTYYLGAFSVNGNSGIINFYRIDEKNGVNETAIANIQLPNINRGHGYMKFSSNNQRFCVVTARDVSLYDVTLLNGGIQFTNQRRLNINTTPNRTSSVFYGCEFTRDSNTLFVTETGYSPISTNCSGKVFRITELNNLTPIVHPQITNGLRQNKTISWDYHIGAIQRIPFSDDMLIANPEENFIYRLANTTTNNPTISEFQLGAGAESLLGLPTFVSGPVNCNDNTTCECNEGFTNIVIQDQILPRPRIDNKKPLYYACGNTHTININETKWMRPLLSCMGEVNGIRPRVTYSIRNEAGVSIVSDRELPQLNTVNGAISIFNTKHFIKLSKDLFPSCGLYTINFTGSCCAEVCGTCEIKLNVTGCEAPKDCITCCLPTSLKDINDNKLFLNQFRNPSLDYQPTTNFKTLINNYLSTIRAEATENNCQLKEGDVDIKLNFYKYNGSANPSDINRTLIRTDFRAFQTAQNNNFQLLSTHSATTNTNFENLLTLNGWYIVELSIKVKNNPDCSTSLIVIKDNNLGKRNTTTNSNKN